MLSGGGGNGPDRLFISDSGNTSGRSGPEAGLLTETTLTGLGMSNAITYTNMESLELSLGSGADTFVVTGTMFQTDYRTISVLNAGPGNDVVTVSLAEGVDGFFALDAGTGDDEVSASLSSLPLVMFGGDGLDTLQGGSGRDIIFGDRGRVDYRNDSGVLITRLGIGIAERTVPAPGQPETSTFVPLGQTDGNDWTPSLAITRDETVGGADTIFGNDGDDIVFGGAAGDDIESTPGDDVVLGDHGQVVFYASGEIQEVSTPVDPILAALGDDDVITTGAGDDVVIGGAGADEIDAGDDDDLIIGDNGRAQFSLSEMLTSVTTTDPAIGDADTIDAGDGANIVIGGVAADTITSGADDDTIAGDNARVDFWANSTQVMKVETTDTVDQPTWGDTIVTGGGTNHVLAGMGADHVNDPAVSPGSVPSSDNDFVIGDNGEFNWDSARAADVAPEQATGFRRRRRDPGGRRQQRRAGRLRCRRNHFRRRQ